MHPLALKTEYHLRIEGPLGGSPPNHVLKMPLNSNYRLMNMIIENTERWLGFYTNHFLTFNNVQCEMLYVFVVANWDTMTITF
ncbi:hypothetical protein C0J52_07246 [Blattella germanica]|nr:hypothetical protein C0J52_07246 [Blattella germanica]